jgi:hypothetical protein
MCLRKPLFFLTGIFEPFGISSVTISPTVSKPRFKGFIFTIVIHSVPEQSERISPETAAPFETASSGLIFLDDFFSSKKSRKIC